MFSFVLVLWFAVSGCLEVEADSVRESEDLLFYVVEEGICWPSSEFHDGEDGLATEIHHHGECSSIAMGSYLFCGETEDVVSNRVNSCSYGI